LKPVLVVGIGNILLRDEGVGVYVVQEMAKRELPENIELLDGGTSGVDLIEHLAHRPKVIVVDSVKMEDIAPGTVYRFSMDELVRQRTDSLSLHELGILESLHMAYQLGCGPGEVVLFGIVPKTLRPPAMELSPELVAIVPKVIDLVLEEAGKVVKA
jgi:hydrogenase maturation protease